MRESKPDSSLSRPAKIVLVAPKKFSKPKNILSSKANAIKEGSCENSDPDFAITQQKGMRIVSTADH